MQSKRPFFSFLFLAFTIAMLVLSTALAGAESSSSAAGRAAVEPNKRTPTESVPLGEDIIVLLSPMDGVEVILFCFAGTIDRIALADSMGVYTPVGFTLLEGECDPSYLMQNPPFLELAQASDPQDGWIVIQGTEEGQVSVQRCIGTSLVEINNETDGLVIVPKENAIECMPSVTI